MIEAFSETTASEWILQGGFGGTSAEEVTAERRVTFEDGLDAIVIASALLLTRKGVN